MRREIAALLVAGSLLLWLYRNHPNGGDMNTRGERNNNPLNIRATSDNWRGAIGTDGEFVIFSSPEYGFRAAAILIGNYFTRYGLHTVADIVARWAPPNENDTAGYVAFVAGRLGVDPRAPLDFSERTVAALLAAMARMETGAEWDRSTILAGWRIAASDRGWTTYA